MTVWKSSPEQYYKTQLIVKSYEDVFQSKSPALSGLKKELGDAHVKALLTIIFVDLVKFFNVGKSMSNDQLAQTISLVQDEYWMLKPEDFKLCFNNAKKGVYGKVYDRLDGQVIFEWLDKYLKDRMDASESRSIRNADLYKKDAEVDRDQRMKEDKNKFIEIQRIKVEQYIKEVNQSKK